MTDDNTFRVWVGCLGCYNGGDLVGLWVDAIEAPQDMDEFREALEAQGGKLRPMHFAEGHEELWCLDIENAPEGYREEMSPWTAQQLAEALEEISSARNGDEDEIAAYWAWVTEHYGRPAAHMVATYMDDFEDHFRGIYASFRDYADDWADEMMGQDSASLRHALRYERGGENFEPYAARYFDYEAHARELESDYSVYNVPGGVAIFSD